jgi:hypothetical protein
MARHMSVKWQHLYATALAFLKFFFRKVLKIDDILRKVKNIRINMLMARKILGQIQTEKPL